MIEALLEILKVLNVVGGGIRFLRSRDDGERRGELHTERFRGCREKSTEPATFGLISTQIDICRSI